MPEHPALTELRNPVPGIAHRPAHSTARPGTAPVGIVSGIVAITLFPLTPAVQPGHAGDEDSPAIGAVADAVTGRTPRRQTPCPAPAYVRSRSQGYASAPPRDRPGLHSMVASAPAGVVSLANRVSVQPARQLRRQAATRDVLPPWVHSAGRDQPAGTRARLGTCPVDHRRTWLRSRRAGPAGGVSFRRGCPIHAGRGAWLGHPRRIRAGPAGTTGHTRPGDALAYHRGRPAGPAGPGGGAAARHQRGIHGPRTAPNPPAPLSYQQVIRARITCWTPPGHGAGRPSTVRAADPPHPRSGRRGQGTGLPVAVRRILAADALKSWQYRSWLFVRDPQFAAKAGRVLDGYARTRAGSRWATTST